MDENKSDTSRGQDSTGRDSGDQTEDRSHGTGAGNADTTGGGVGGHEGDDDDDDGVGTGIGGSGPDSKLNLGTLAKDPSEPFDQTNGLAGDLDGNADDPDVYQAQHGESNDSAVLDDVVDDDDAEGHDADNEYRERP